MRTRRSTSSLISCQSEEEYIEKNRYAFKCANPKLTFRQVKNKLQSEWNIFNNKPKRQTKLDDFVIQISPSPKQTSKQKQEKKKNQKHQKQQNKNKVQKNLKKNQNNKLKKTRISPSSKQGPSIETFDSESFKISLTSQEENQPVQRESPVVISTSSFQIQKANQSCKKKKTNSKKKKEETKSNSIDHKKDQQKTIKQLLNLPIKKSCRLKKLNNLNNLSKCNQINKPEAISEYKPILLQDFINSSKQHEHISVITVSKSRIEQGQVGVDEIKDIVSHTYGIINHEQNNSENLNFQLFFQVEFQPKENGFIPQKTFCTSKQAAFYCKDLALKYISKNKDIFTQNEEYYLQ